MTKKDFITSSNFGFCKNTLYRHQVSSNLNNVESTDHKFELR